MDARDYFTQATPATPGAWHCGEHVGIIARAFGTPLFPFQQHIARVASERDGAGWRYPVVVLDLPRQVGKSVLSGATQVQRSLMFPGHISRSTAQTGLAARDLWKVAVSDPIEAMPELNARAKINKGAGTAHVAFSNGSEIRPFAPGPKCLDSKQTDQLVVDEAFAHTDISGAALMASAGPTQLTRPLRQLWIISAAGTTESTWLAGWLARGRAAEPGIAYFGWWSDLDDPDDPAAIRNHPAVRAGLVTAAALWSERTKYTPDAWRRGFLNLWPTAAASTGVIDLDMLATLAEPATLPPLSTMWVALDVARDRSASTIYAAWRDGALVRVASIATGPGTGWLADAVASLTRKVAGIVGDPTGPTRTILTDLDIAAISTRDYASACQWWLDRLADRGVRHDGADHLTAAHRLVVLKDLGGVSAFDLAKSKGPIDALRAAAIAGYHAATKPNGLQVF